MLFVEAKRSVLAEELRLPLGGGLRCPVLRTMSCNVWPLKTVEFTQRWNVPEKTIFLGACCLNPSTARRGHLARAGELGGRWALSRRSGTRWHSALAEAREIPGYFLANPRENTKAILMIR